MRRLPIGAQDAIPPHNSRPMGTRLKITPVQATARRAAE